MVTQSRKTYLPLPNLDHPISFRHALLNFLADCDISYKTAAAYMGYGSPEWLRQVLHGSKPYLTIGEEYVHNLIDAARAWAWIPSERLGLYEDQLRTARFFTLEVRQKMPNLTFPVKPESQEFVDATWQAARDYAARTKRLTVSQETIC